MKQPFGTPGDLANGICGDGRKFTVQGTMLAQPLIGASNITTNLPIQGGRGYRGGLLLPRQ